MRIYPQGENCFKVVMLNEGCDEFAKLLTSLQASGHHVKVLREQGRERTFRLDESK